MAGQEDKKEVVEEETEEEEDAEEEEKRKEKEKQDREARKEKVLKRKQAMQKKAGITKTEIDELNDTNIGAAPQSAAKSSIREDIVNSCVNFLNHPKVKNYPLAQKTEYLKKKGLTPEEIQEAFQRANGGTSTTSKTVSIVPPAPALPSPPSYSQPPYNQYPQGYQNGPPYQPPQYGMYVPPQNMQVANSWYNGRGFAATAITCFSIGVGITILAKKFIPWFGGDSDEQREKDQEKEKETKVMEQIAETLKMMQEQSTEMKELVKNVADQSKTASKDKASLSEIQAEIRNFKASVLDRKSFSTESTTWTTPAIPKKENISIPSWQTESTKALSYTPSSPDFHSKITQQPTKNPKEHASTVMGQQGIETAEYSSKFQQVIDIVSKGGIPPDIKEINDKPLNPEEKIPEGKRAAPSKPWQQKDTKPVQIPSSTTSEEPEKIDVEKQEDEDQPRVQEITEQ